MGSIGLLEACRHHGVKRFVFASTGGAIYGEADTIPTPEGYPAAPLSPYGAAKLSVEHYLHLFHEIDGFSYAALRFANVYGPRQDPHGEAGVVAIFSGALLDGRPVVVNGDGEQTRDYVFVEDVAAAMDVALSSDASGAFNVGTATETTVNQLFDLVRAASGRPGAAAHGPARPGEQRRSCIAIERAATVLGWRPTVPLEAGIERTVEYFAGARS